MISGRVRSLPVGKEDVLTVFRRIEGAVKQILCGMNVKTSASVANAGCLEWYRQWTSNH